MAPEALAPVHPVHSMLPGARDRCQSMLRDRAASVSRPFAVCGHRPENPQTERLTLAQPIEREVGIPSQFREWSFGRQNEGAPGVTARPFNATAVDGWEAPARPRGTRPLPSAQQSMAVGCWPNDDGPRIPAAQPRARPPKHRHTPYPSAVSYLRQSGPCRVDHRDGCIGTSHFHCQWPDRNTRRIPMAASFV